MNNRRPKQRFTVEDLRSLERKMAQKYPNNRHVRETIRDVTNELQAEGFLREESPTEKRR
jgi:hypothetical protein